MICFSALLEKPSVSCIVVTPNHVSSVYFLADDEFQHLCFEFGLELDEIVSNLIIMFHLGDCN